MSDMAITFTIVAVIVVLFVWDRFPVVVVAMATAVAFWATGVLDLGQALTTNSEAMNTTAGSPKPASA